MAQQITLTIDISGGVCDGSHNLTVPFIPPAPGTPATINGKYAYIGLPFNPMCRLSISWKNNRWELNRESGVPFVPSESLFFNTADTFTPPCGAAGWVATENCPTCSLSITSGDCDSSITNANSTDIPTLSQWGLIILALLLMTFGTLYLIQPNLQREKDR